MTFATSTTTAGRMPSSGRSCSHDDAKPGVQRPLVDLVGGHPRELAALGVADRRLERRDHVADERRVAPVAEVEDAQQARPDGGIRNPRLFRGLAQRAVARRLALVPRAAGQRPRVAEVAPRHAMLQQHAALGIEREQPGGAEPAPVPLPRRRHDPRVAGVARTERAPRLSGGGRLDRHPPSLSHRAGHRLRIGPVADIRRLARMVAWTTNSTTTRRASSPTWCGRTCRPTRTGAAGARAPTSRRSSPRRGGSSAPTAPTPASRSASRAPSSDGVGFAYLADVFVLAEHRGHALGKQLMQRMIEDGPGRDFRWVLFTADAHGLYEQFGFAAPMRRRWSPEPPG